MSDRLDDFRQALRDPARPLPPAVWMTLTVLASLVLFLGLRLHVVGTGEGSAAAAARPTLAASSPAAFAELVEGWREAWVARDLDRYLSYYARTFGAQGKDRAAWSQAKALAFASEAPFTVEISDLRPSVLASIGTVTFVQVYRSREYQDRGVKTLYLLPENGRWRIFNEEWTPLASP